MNEINCGNCEECLYWNNEIDYSEYQGVEVDLKEVSFPHGVYAGI